MRYIDQRENDFLRHGCLDRSRSIRWYGSFIRYVTWIFSTEQPSFQVSFCRGNQCFIKAPVSIYFSFGLHFYFQSSLLLHFLDMLEVGLSNLQNFSILFQAYFISWYFQKKGSRKAKRIYDLLRKEITEERALFKEMWTGKDESTLA